jgi:hypothetical protein
VRLANAINRLLERVDYHVSRRLRRRRQLPKPANGAPSYPGVDKLVRR